MTGTSEGIHGGFPTGTREVKGCWGDGKMEKAHRWRQRQKGGDGYEAGSQSGEMRTREAVRRTMKLVNGEYQI